MGKLRVALRGFHDALDRLMADPEPSGEVARKAARRSQSSPPRSPRSGGSCRDSVTSARVNRWHML
jgi:hypothetical protein